MTMTGDDDGAGQVSGPSDGRAAVEQLVDAGLLDELMAKVDAGGLQLTGKGGFLPEMIKAVLERGLAAELTEHLGYEKGDPAGRGSPKLSERLHTQDAGDRGRRRGSGDASGPGRHLRASPGPQGCPAGRRAG
jgi:hypothetical protein